MHKRLILSLLFFMRLSTAQYKRAKLIISFSYEASGVHTDANLRKPQNSTTKRDCFTSITVNNRFSQILPVSHFSFHERGEKERKKKPSVHSQDARRHEYKAAPVDPPAHKLQCSDIQTAPLDSIIERRICKEERGTNDFYFSAS